MFVSPVEDTAPPTPETLKTLGYRIIPMNPGKELVLPNQSRKGILDEEDVIPEVGLGLGKGTQLQRKEMECPSLRHMSGPQMS